jgi:aspartyl protease family protein
MADPHGPWRHAPPPPPKTRSRLGLLLWLGLMAAAAAVFFLLMRLFPEQRSGMEWADAFRLFGLLALVSSGLVATRSLDLGLAARNIALWAAIFTLAFLAYAFRGDLLSVGLRARSALIPAYAVANSPTSIVVSRGEGGGFYVMGSVNGAPVRFIVDTGASDTANGIGYGAPVTVNSLAVGPIHLSKVPVFINQAPMRESLLGMAFLDRLESFEFRGDQLFLRGRR